MKKIWAIFAVLLLAAAFVYIASVKKVEAPAIVQTFTVQAGQVTNYPFSYWGFEKCGSYATVRLQSGEPGAQTATYTFETLPATIQIDKHFYNITYYDNTKIVVDLIQ